VNGLIVVDISARQNRRSDRVQAVQHLARFLKPTFAQAYDSDLLDASALLIPQVGFLPPTTRASMALSRPSRISARILRDWGKVDSLCG
jgi:hypothetical protein